MSEVSEDLYAAAWSASSSAAWQARHGLTAEQYQQTFDQLVQEGYRLTCVNGYAAGDQALYAALWEQTGGPTWQARHGLTAEQYQQTFDQLVQDGYRLRSVSGYGVGGVDYYAARWEQAGGPAWQARHRMSSEDYQATFDQLLSEGYRLCWVSAYVVGDTDLYAAMWEQTGGGAWQARHRMSASEFVEQATAWARQGYRLTCVSGYSFDGSDHYAALWQQPADGATIWHAGMPAATYQRRFDVLQGKGFRPYFVTGYEGTEPLDISLPFEVQAQTESEWCWAAVSTSVNHYYDPASTVTQCEVVNHQKGRTDCCTNPSSSACNQPGYLDQALQYLGNFASETGQGTWQDLVPPLNASDPPCIRIGWAGGGGHFIGVNGCEPGELIAVTDPIYGDSLVTYQTLATGKYEGSGTWTNTYFTQP